MKVANLVVNDAVEPREPGIDSSKWHFYYILTPQKRVFGVHH